MTQPTIVLVHGAFADGSSWAPVARRLLDTGFRVAVPAIANRSLDADSAYIRSFVEQIDGPVLLAGHSYGGAVITVAGAAANVVGLVYAAAYVPDEGESPAALAARFPDSDLGPHLVFRRFPVEGGDPGAELSVDPGAFPEIFAGGVRRELAEVLAVSQRPASAAALGEATSVAAWKTTPSWGIVATQDRTLQPDMERFGYSRAGSRRVLELPSSHLVMLAHVDEVADFITAIAVELSE
jgi:pimeloyl-ACP methyl ester carboxylesterase